MNKYTSIPPLYVYWTSHIPDTVLFYQPQAYTFISYSLKGYFLVVVCDMARSLIESSVSFFSPLPVHVGYIFTERLHKF